MTGPGYAIISSLAFSHPLLRSWGCAGLAGLGGVCLFPLCVRVCVADGVAGGGVMTSYGRSCTEM